MSGEFRVRVQTGPSSHKTLPVDGEIARDLAEAMAEVREAVELEQNERHLYEDGKVLLTALQSAVERRRAMEDRAIEVFRMALDGIPHYLATGPDRPREVAPRSRKQA